MAGIFPRKDYSKYSPNPDTVQKSYCHSCGRVMSSSKQSHATPTKYCSARCRNHKPSSAHDSLDSRISQIFATLLDLHPSVQLLEPSTPLKDLDYGNGSFQAEIDRITGHDGGGNGSASGSRGQRSEERMRAKGSGLKKGERRRLVLCSEVERLVFGVPADAAEKVFGRGKNRKRRGVDDGPEWKSVDMLDDVSGGGDRRGNGVVEVEEIDGVPIRLDEERVVESGDGNEEGDLPQGEESENQAEMRRAGQRRAEERELVRCVARRGCAFGFVSREGSGVEIDGPEKEKAKGGKKKRGKNSEDGEDGEEVEDGGEVKRKCEAVQNSKVVESSFAKGDWGIRWQE